MARSIRVARERMWVVWWLLVVALIGAVAVSDGIGADHAVESTDTTAVSGSGSGTRDHGGERPPNCSHGEVTLDNGTTKCRHCTRRTYYHNGSRCVPVGRTPGCPAGQAIVSTWPGTCVPIRCPSRPGSSLGEWRSLRTGRCTSSPTTTAPPAPTTTLALSGDPTPPTDVTADGHSPTDSSGQSVITWRASHRALKGGYTLARYEIRYGSVSEPGRQDRIDAVLTLVDLLPSVWLPRRILALDRVVLEPVQISVSTTTHTLTLALNTLWRVEVRAVYTATDLATKYSEWRHAYTYPTHDPSPRRSGEKVGVIPVTRYRPADPGGTDTEPGEYRYKQCINGEYLPPGISSSDRGKLFAQILLGIHVWNDTDEVEAIRLPQDDCTDDEVDHHGATASVAEARQQLHTNVFILAPTGEEMRAHCGNEDTRGCASHYPIRGDSIRSTKLVLNADVEYVDDLRDASCTEAYVLAMHEAGHAFGLGDTTSIQAGNYGLWPTVMSQSLYSKCEPTALDIAALKAIYQSR